MSGRRLPTSFNSTVLRCGASRALASGNLAAPGSQTGETIYDMGSKEAESFRHILRMYGDIPSAVRPACQRAQEIVISSAASTGF